MTVGNLTGFRLSPQQKRIWSLLQAGHCAPYVAQCAVLIEGTFDTILLHEALQRTAGRHEILRTAFHLLDTVDLPVQVIADSCYVPLDEHDLTGLDSQLQQVRIETLSGKARETGFDFECGPLLYASLIHLSSARKVLLITASALCADAASLKSLTREIWFFLTEGGTGEYSENVMQYADLSEILNELLEAEDTLAGREYWQSKGKFELSRLRLPFDDSDSVSSSFTPQVLRVPLGVELTSRVEAAAGKYDVDVSVLLLACWQVLLWRLSGVQAVVVGAAFDGRNYAGLEQSLGLFTRYLPVLSRLHGNLQFGEVLSNTAGSVREAHEWQEYFPVHQSTVDCGDGPRFFPFGFEYHEWPEKRCSPGLSLSLIDLYTCLDRYKLKLSWQRAEDLHIAGFHYDCEAYRLEDVERLSKAFLRQLESVTENPERAIAQLDILSETERLQLLVEFNDTHHAYPSDRCIHQLFEEQAARTPHRVAVRFKERELTYSELNARSNRLAHLLLSIGVGPESLVGLYAERSVEMVVGLLGALKAGGAYVPLDPNYPKERLALMIDDARPGVLLTEQKLAGGLPNGGFRIVCVDSDWEKIARMRDSNPQPYVMPENPAYVIYTSGSTGRPKGVMISHRGICNHMVWMLEKYPLSEQDRILQKTPFSFDASVWEFYAPLLSGACLAMAAPGGHQDAEYLVDTIHSHEITILQLVPTLLKLLLDQPGFEQCESLRRVFSGGEPLVAELRDRFHERMKASLHNLYGPTEATIEVIVWDCQRGGKRKVIPIGKPITNTRAYILDGYLEPAPAGVAAQLYVGGDGLARGYLERPDQTADKFVPDPFSAQPGGRLYKTGDLARYLPDGNIEFLGRLDHQVKLRGFRIEMGEIESVLRSSRGVEEAVVVVREEEGTERRLVGYIVCKQGEGVSASELRGWMSERLPDYMVPSALVMLDRLPLTPNGKVDRNALPAPDKSRRYSTRVILPRTPDEEVLAKIWRDILGLDQVGIHDNFFEMGGDSILGIQIIARANQAGLGLSPRQLFMHQTIAELASVVESKGGLEAEQGVVTGRVPLTPIQEAFFEFEPVDPNHFNQALLLETGEEIEGEKLRRVVGELLVHHDALRMRFNKEGREWVQENMGVGGEVPVIEIDLREVEGGKQSRLVEEAAGQIQRSLDIGSGRVVRVGQMKLGETGGERLMIVIHHLVVDAVSFRILVEDLQRGYGQVKGGGEVELGVKTTSYKRWAEVLKEEAQREGLKREAGYWGEQEVRRMRREEGGVENMEGSSETVREELSREETEMLIREAAKAYRTEINEVMLAAVSVAYERWSGEEGVVVEIEGHGREEIVEGVDVSRTVGWFTSIYPVRLEVGGVKSEGEAIKKVKEQIRGVPGRGIGYGMLRYLSEEEGIRKEVRGGGEAEISYNYLGQVDRVLGAESAFRPAREFPGPVHGPLTIRRCPIQVTASIVEGQLHFDWTYSTRTHGRASIEDLVQSFIEILRAFISHCASPEAGDYLPSDFPLAELGKNDLDIAFAKVEFED